MSFPSADKEPDKSAAWADLFIHKYQQADQSGAVCDLRGSRAAIIIYRCGPAALMMEGCWGGRLWLLIVLSAAKQPTPPFWCCLLSVNRSVFLLYSGRPYPYLYHSVTNYRISPGLSEGGWGSQVCSFYDKIHPFREGRKCWPADAQDRRFVTGLQFLAKYL